MTGYVAHMKNIKYETDCIGNNKIEKDDLISLLTKIRGIHRQQGDLINLKSLKH
jgi:hypothetical protein